MPEVQQVLNLHTSQISTGRSEVPEEASQVQFVIGFAPAWIKLFFLYQGGVLGTVHWYAFIASHIAVYDGEGDDYAIEPSCIIPTADGFIIYLDNVPLGGGLENSETPTDIVYEAVGPNRFPASHHHDKDYPYKGEWPSSGGGGPL